MSVDVAPPPARAVPTGASQPLDPRLADRWRRWRRVVLVAGLVFATAVVLAVVDSQQRRGYLDPDGVDRGGSRALVRLLEAEGVRVDEVRTTGAAEQASGPGATLLVTVPDLLRPEQVRRLTATGADLVLVAPTDVVTDVNGTFSVSSVGRDEEREPRCDLPVARRAGSARVGGITYDVPDDAESCYPSDGDGSLVVGTVGDAARLVVLGTGAPLTNEHLDEGGNASLALGLLGENAELVWYRPTIEAGQEEPLTALLPDWVLPVMWQLGFAAVLAAMWRARRLGRVVTEPLPVVVRSAEATEGRARLYRHGRARDHAATILREAAADRLRSRLGVPPDATPAAVAESVAARTGRPAADVANVLAGPAPPDDAAFVGLADSLDTLEQEVRSR
jgi:hypothetical protein